ncbi:MAG: hypothetical protein ABFQ65_00265 [Nanoarchaeota archaeon]
MKKINTKEIILISIIILAIPLFLTMVKAGTDGPPQFTVNPNDSPDPVEEGNTVTFTATAEDPKSDDWYLAICKTNEITDGTPPTCNGGAYCVSGATAHAAQASCGWTSDVSGAWYGFPCDGQEGCGTMVNTNSPITVTSNTAPDITGTVSNDGPKDEAQTITFTGACTDADGGDLFHLVVCQGGTTCNDATSGADLICKGTSATDTTPSCSYVTTSGDVGINTGDIATCCDDSGDCDATTVSVNDWTVNDITPPGFEDAQVNESIIGLNQYARFKINVTDSSSNISYTNGTIEGTTYSFSDEDGQTGKTGFWYYDWQCTSSNSAVDFTYAGANDTVGNWNSTTITGINTECDATAPSLSNEGANETTINENSYFCLNITVSDTEGNLDAVYAEVWDTSSWANYTMSDAGSTSCDGGSADGIYGLEFQGTSQGIWNFSRAYANDSVNNLNTYDFTDLTINVTAPSDSEYPQFSNFQEYLSNNSDYSYGQTYQFNTTVTNINGTVFLEFNGTNYSALNDTTDNFYVDFSSLSAGTYSYYWGGYGNGTSELYNISGIRSYVVKKINPTGSLTNTDAWSITYPEEVTIGLSESNSGDTDVTYKIYRDNVDKGTGETITLGYGTYDYILNTTGGANYTANESIESQTFTVNQNTGACSVLFNETSPINYSSTFKVWTNCNSDFTLYRNGTAISNNSVQDLAAGGYNFTVIRTDKSNYSIISDEQIFTVQKAEGLIYTYINNQRSNQSILVNNEKWLNATLITGVGDITLYYNDTIINQGTSPLSNLTNFADEGVFNITGIYLGNENYTSASETWWATVSSDSAPTINLVYPQNINYNTNVSELNYTVSDDIALDICWYSTNSGITNTTITCGNNVTNLNSIEGSNTWTVWANDSIGQESSDSATFFKDTIYPTVTSLTESPSDPTTYSLGATYEFNATITDTNLETVLIEFDGTNYTPSNLGDVYNFSISDLSAGVYNYKWFVNDTTNNINLTEIQTYTINNATGDVTLLINGSASDQTITYGIQTNASSTTSYGSVTIYRNGIDVTGENNNFVTLGVGYYNYTSVSSGDQNHSSISVTRFVNITRANSEVNLSLNGTEENITITQDSSILLNGTLITGDLGATLKLYNDGILINQGTTEVSNQTTFNTVGFFNITVYYIESQNYTYSSETFWVNVTEAPDLTNPSVTLLTENPTDPTNYSPGATYEFNVTITDNREIDLVFIEFDGTNYTPSNLSDVYNFTISGLSVGTYSYYWFANDTSGNVNNTQNRTYTINQKIPSLNLTITPLQSETYGIETIATGSDCPAELTCNLYREHILVDNSDTQTLGVAVYNYTYNTTGNVNYSATSISKLLTITQASSSVYTYLDNSRSNKSINNNTAIWLNGTLVTGSGNIKIYNNGTLINSGTSLLSNYTLFDQVGLYNITTIYEGNENYTSSSETWWVDVLAVDLINPNVVIIYPQNISYNSIQTELNYSVFDNQDLDSCWYSIDKGITNNTINCGENITGLNSNQGSNTWIVWANDTNENENSSSIVFFVDSIFPTIDFVAPTKTSNSPTIENLIEINISANDTNLDTIVIRLYNSTHDLIKANFSINSLFFINYTGLPAGIYYYNATVNDTLNNQNSTETRAINLILPSLTIYKPKNKTYVANTSLLLDYSATNTDTVWYNIDSVQNITIDSDTYFNTSGGSHTLYLYANNSNGVISKNVTFFINLTQFEIGYSEWESSYKGNSTNFNEYPFDEIQNLSNVILENTLHGKILFNEAINLTDDENPADNQIDIDSYINISDNKIEINSTGLPNFNKSATLYFYNLTFSNPRILRDGDICPSTICTLNNYLNGNLDFNVTHFTIYSTEETPLTQVVVSTGGGGGRAGDGGVSIKDYECFNDSECKDKDEVCLNHLCVKLFDIKIIDFESPAKLGEFFDFTYFIKGMANISGDVEINFWIGDGEEILTSGSDVIYLGNFEEKTETTKIFLPKSVKSGVYEFFVEVYHERYKARSHRTIEIEVEGGIAKIISIEDKSIKNYIIFILICVIIFSLITFYFIRKNKRAKITSEELIEDIKKQDEQKPKIKLVYPKQKYKPEEKGSLQISKKKFIEQKYKLEKKENLQIPQKKFAEQIVKRVKKEIPSQPEKIQEINNKKQKKIIPQIKKESTNTIENTEKRTFLRSPIKRIVKKLSRKKRNIDDMKEMFEEKPKVE